ncbi:MAG: DUF91 domain-containing protein [Nanoarchaeota archaeon]|nr:DUF91 domain-containing protein [Nanoarchaeota archaeon]
MSGYIGITDYEWFHFHKNKKHREVIFWRKSSRPVNLREGVYFFFLVKGYRLIEGYGITDEVSSKPITELWEQYKEKLGAETLEELCEKLGKSENETIGYYKLKEVTYLEGGIDLQNTGINFSPAIVSGKTISYEETRKLLETSGDKNKLKIIKEPLEPKQRKIYYPRQTHVSENNLESIVAERLDDIEPGLRLIKRQYSIPPVGRIDLYCKDKNGDLVVIELKKFRAKDYSIMDQITKYMGWIKENEAKPGQEVRGIIIVAQKNERLEYASKVVQNLQVKTFSLLIE